MNRIPFSHLPDRLKRFLLSFLAFVILTICLLPSAYAGVQSYAVREAAEFVMKKFGKEAVKQGADLLSRKIGSLASRYGDNALLAFKRVGPRVGKLADDAGEQAPVALRLLAGHGDDAVRVVAKPSQLGLVAKLGDDAAASLMKHGDVAEPLLSSFGQSAAKALNKVSPQNARRLAMMASDGKLAKLGRADEVLNVISRYGDAGANFLYRNAAGLAVGASLTAFLANPEPFINGGTDLASMVSEAAVKPVVAAAAQSVPWLLIMIVTGLIGGSFCGWRYWAWRTCHMPPSPISASPATVSGDHKLNGKGQTSC